MGRHLIRENILEENNIIVLKFLSLIFSDFLRFSSDQTKVMGTKKVVHISCENKCAKKEAQCDLLIYYIK